MRPSAAGIPTTDRAAFICSRQRGAVRGVRRSRFAVGRLRRMRRASTACCAPPLLRRSSAASHCPAGAGRLWALRSACSTLRFVNSGLSLAGSGVLRHQHGDRTTASGRRLVRSAEYVSVVAEGPAGLAANRREHPPQAAPLTAWHPTTATASGPLGQDAIPSQRRDSVRRDLAPRDDRCAIVKGTPMVQNSGRRSMTLPERRVARPRCRRFTAASRINAQATVLAPLEVVAWPLAPPTTDDSPAVPKHRRPVNVGIVFPISETRSSRNSWRSFHEVAAQRRFSVHLIDTDENAERDPPHRRRVVAGGRLRGPGFPHAWAKPNCGR